MIPEGTALFKEGPGRREWLVAFLLSLLLSLALLIPHGLSYLAAAPGSFYTGTLMNPEDSHTYFAKMQTGYEGDWLYRDPFTSEPHDPFFVGAFYIFLGHVARWTGQAPMLIWHGARVFTALFMFLAAFNFICAFLRSRTARWMAFLLALFGSGLGWLLFLLGRPYWLGAFPIDFKMPEARPLFTALTFPHVAFSTSMLLLSFWATLNALHHRRRRWLYATLAGASNLLLVIVHPLLIYVVFLAGALYWIALTLRERTILWREGFVYVVAFLFLAPLVLYYQYTLVTNPVFAGWDAQREITQSPPWPHFLVAFGPYLLLALLWFFADWRRRVARPPWLFLWIWLLATALLVYAPLNSQRRFIQGIHVALAILAGAAFVDILLPRILAASFIRRLTARPRYSRDGLARFLSLLFLGAMGLSNLYLLSSVGVSAIVQQPDLIFRPAAEARAASWLQARAAPDEVVLGEYETGNYVAAQTTNPVVIGHWAETIEFAEKQRDVRRFFTTDVTEDWRRTFLERHDVRYVWHGPREQKLGNWEPEQTPYLEMVYAEDGIAIYKVLE